MKNLAILGILLIAIISSCLKQSRWIMIDQTKEYVIEQLVPSKKDSSMLNLKYYISGDTIIIGQYLQNQPIETMYLFRDGVCYHQEMNIYCSVCAEQTKNCFINDKKFKFIKVDDVNYISKKYKDIIMRVKNIGSEENTCSEIKITKINAPIN